MIYHLIRGRKEITPGVLLKAETQKREILYHDSNNGEGGQTRRDHSNAQIN